MTIAFDLGCDLGLEFWRSNIKSAIAQPKMVRLPRNKKQTYRLNFMPQMWPSDLTVTVTLTSNFQGQVDLWNLLYLSQKWSDCHGTKNEHIDWTLCLKRDHRIDIGHDLDLAFSRSNLEFAIFQPKMVWLPQNEKYTYRLNWGPQWPSSSTLAMTLKGEV